MRARLHRKSKAKNRLLAAAELLFAERGFLGVSVRDLLAAAKTCQPVLYYHFGSKEGLYLAVAQRVVRVYAASLAAAVSEGGTAVERVRRVGRAHIAARREWALIGVSAASSSLCRIPGSGDEGRPEGVLELVEKLVVEGIESGDIMACNASAAALALVGAAEAVIVRYPSCSAGLPGDLFDEVVDLVLAGITPQVRS